ncbi:MFS transporter [Halomonas sp. HK25]|uniref:MFS transporter n=1 Tax=Halomonas sp. HK25 TaxID=3394321 RepID=UPI0039FC200C
MLKLTSPATVVTLAALTALGPLATDMYLPAMPAMAEALDTGPDRVQLTLSLYMAGFALAQLLCGPISDRFGRKPIMVGGFALFLAASLLCAFAPSIESLLAGRFLQALGGAAGPVLGRAAVRDIYGPLEAGRILSHLASIMALAPALAPVMGAGLLLVFGWEAIFLVLALYAAIALALLALAGVYQAWAVVGPHIVFMMGVGILMPQTMAGALAPNPQCAGSASSLFGFLQMGIAAVVGGLVGQLHDGTSRTLALSIGLAGLLALTSHLLLVHRRVDAAERCPAGEG